MIRTSKMGTTYVALAIIIVGASATIMMMTAMTTTTAAFAQSAQQQQRKGTCPDGFQLNRGVCQADPTLTCENYNVYQPRTNIDENGDCIVTEFTTAVCLNEDGTEVLGFYFPGNDCIDTATKQIVPNAEPACKDPYHSDHPINTATLTTERGTIECVFYTNIGPADQKCDIGTLNEQTGMCEIKPGNSKK